MRIVPTPTAEPLPFRADDGQTSGSTPPLAKRPTLPLRGDAIARFDAYLHELNPDAVRVDMDRMQHLLDWLLSLPEAEAHDVLDRRLRRLDDLRSMVADPEWDAEEAMRARLAKLFAYIDREDDLIGDHEPLLGLLDDVLMIELAWPAFADEAEDYRDFCAYRSVEHPPGSPQDQRAAWVRDRMAEIALWQHKLRVSSSHYVRRGHAENLFRVG